MNNEEVAKKIISLCGEKSNLIGITNCMTRCRLTVSNPSLVQTEALKKTDGVLGLICDDKSFQIVLGPGKAKKITDIILATTGFVSNVTENWKENKERIKSNQKQNSVKTFIRVIANIFIPLIPAVIAAGLFNGLASLLGTLQGQKILPDTGFWKVAQLSAALIGGGFFGYFAVYTGINAAKLFGATEALGGMIGAISIGANITAISKIFGLFNAEVPLNSILTTGKGGVIGVIAGVWILSKIERFLRKKIPDVLDLVLTPFLTMLITTILFVFIIMPIAGFISDGMVAGLKVIIMSQNPFISIISGYILAAVFLPMVLLGLHHGLIPIYAVQLEAFGGVSLFPVLAMAGAGQVGAAIAIYLVAKKVKNERIQKVITGALPAGFLGVGEPLIYGVTLPLFKPFITAGLGAGFGGAYVMLTHVMSSAWGPSGLVAIAIIQPQHMLNYFFGLVISYVAGFIITKLVIKPKDLENV
jgi:PTS system sucrose-specific IIBC component